MSYGLCWYPFPSAEETTVVVKTEPKQCPLVRREISLSVRQDGVHGKEQFFFMNQEKQSVNTEFRFPSKRCRIHGLRFRNDEGTWKEMMVEDKVKAQAKFDHAISTGNQAAIAKTDGYDYFSIEVGRLQSYQMVVVEINYIAESDWANSYVYRHQLTAFQHYIPNGDMEDQCKTRFPKLTESDLSYGVFLSVSFEDTQPFTAEVISDMIAKDLKSNENNVVILPRTLISGKKDVTVRMIPTTSKPSVFSTETEDKFYFQVCCGHTPMDIGVAKLVTDKTKADKHLTAMLNEYETGEDNVVSSDSDENHYTFVVDGSASMSGSRINHARKALKIAIKQLPEDSKYSVMVFGSNNPIYTMNNYYPKSTRVVKDAKKTPPIHYGIYCDRTHRGPIEGNRWKMIGKDYDLCNDEYIKLSDDEKKLYELIDPPSQKTIAELAGEMEVEDDLSKEWIVHNDDTYPITNKHIDEHVNANYGGTEMEVAIHSVYQRLSTTGRNVIVILTDAGINEPQTTRIHRFVDEHDIKAEIYCLGIGTGYSATFLDTLAKIGSGVSKHIIDNSEIKEVTQRLMRCAVNSQYLRNLSMSVPSHVKVTSSKPVDVYFYGEPMTFYLEVDKDKFTGEEVAVLKSDETDMLSLSLASHTMSQFDLKQVFHMTLLEQMLNYPQKFYSYDPVHPTLMTKEEYTKMVVKLACDYSIVTKYTSAIVVEKLTNTEDGSIELKKVDIPIGTPKSEQYNHSNLSRGRPMRHMACGAPTAIGLPKIMKAFMKTRSAPLHMNQMDRPSTFSALSDSSMNYSEEEYLEEDFEYSESSMKSFKEKSTSFASNSKTPSKTVTKSAEELVEQLVGIQKISDGSWIYNKTLINDLISTKYEKYITIFDSMIIDDTTIMTLFVMAYFQYHTELYAIYDSSYNKGMEFLKSKGVDVNLIDQLTLVGFA